MLVFDREPSLEAFEDHLAMKWYDYRENGQF